MNERLRKQIVAVRTRVSLKRNILEAFDPNSDHKGLGILVVCDIIVKQFEPLSNYYVHFRTNAIGKGNEPSNTPSYGLNRTGTVLQAFGIE